MQRKETSKARRMLQILSNFRKIGNRRRRQKEKSRREEKGLDGDYSGNSTISMVPVTTSTIFDSLLSGLFKDESKPKI